MAVKDTIKGTSLSLSYERTNPSPMDTSATFPSIEEAKEYAENKNGLYRGYPGQIIAVSQKKGDEYETSTYKLVEQWRQVNQVTGLVEFYKCKLEEMIGKDAINSQYLSRDQDDSNNGHTLSVGDLIVQKGGTGNGKGSVKAEGDITAQGTVQAPSADFGTTRSTNVVASSIQSPNATHEQGLIITTNSGRSSMLIDSLDVRGKFTAHTIEYAETTYIKGIQIISPGGGFECIKVEPVSNGSVTIGWRCYYKNKETEDSAAVIGCAMRVGDTAICQYFGDGGSRFYWREVIDLNTTYGFITLSATSAESVENDTPLVGDKIVHLGAMPSAPSSRKCAIVLSAQQTTAGNDGSVPRIAQYNNIENFRWGIPTTEFSASGNTIRGNLLATAEGGADDINVGTLINDLQASNQEIEQALGDGLEYWFGEGTPDFTKSMYPHNTWQTTEYVNHIGDLYYDTKKDSDTYGQVYKFDHIDGQFVWSRVEDAALSAALEKAIQALSSAEDSQKILSDMADDTIITDQEKGQLEILWQSISGEFQSYFTQLEDYSDEAKETLREWEVAYNELKLVIEEALAAPGSYDVKNISWKALWQKFYSKRSDFLSVINAETADAITNITDKEGMKIYQSREEVEDADYKKGELWANVTFPLEGDGTFTDPFTEHTYSADDPYYQDDLLVCVKSKDDAFNIADWLPTQTKSRSFFDMTKEKIDLINSTLDSDYAKKSEILLKDGAFAIIAEALKGDETIKAAINGLINEFGQSELQLSADKILFDAYKALTVNSNGSQIVKIDQAQGLQAIKGLIAGWTIKQSQLLSEQKSHNVTSTGAVSAYDQLFLDTVYGVGTTHDEYDSNNTRVLRKFHWQLKPDGSGQLADGKIQFDAQGNATIANWHISSDSIYAVLDDNYLSLGSNGTIQGGNKTTPAWQLNANGTGFLAGNNLRWSKNAEGKWELTMDGSGTFNGTVTATAGKIGGWTLAGTLLKSEPVADGTDGYQDTILLSPEYGLMCRHQKGDDYYDHWHFHQNGNLTLGRTADGLPLFAIDAVNQKATFRGELQAATGTFKGRLEAATGSFTGKVTAESGEFAGFIKVNLVGLTDSNSTPATWGDETGYRKLKNDRHIAVFPMSDYGKIVLPDSSDMIGQQVLITDFCYPGTRIMPKNSHTTVVIEGKGKFYGPFINYDKFSKGYYDFYPDKIEFRGGTLELLCLSGGDKPIWVITNMECLERSFYIDGSETIISKMTCEGAIGEGKRIRTTQSKKSFSVFMEDIATGGDLFSVTVQENRVELGGKAPGGTLNAIGVDAVGPYIYKQGTKKYL